MKEWIAGVDGCKGGWAVAYAPADDLPASEIKLFKTFEEILNRQPQFALIFIDIPIGLEQDKDRDCDKLAREKLHSRGSCVFPAPLRPALRAWEYDAYEEAKRLTRELGRGLNKQSHALFKKIQEVDQWMTPKLQDQVIETHPEIIFTVMNGTQALDNNKKTDLGRKERLDLLSPHFHGIKEKLQSRPKGIGRDDFLDAYACLLAAHQYRRGNFHRLPESPSRDAKGLKMEMVFPKFSKK